MGIPKHLHWIKKKNAASLVYTDYSQHLTHEQRMSTASNTQFKKQTKCSKHPGTLRCDVIAICRHQLIRAVCSAHSVLCPRPDRSHYVALLEVPVKFNTACLLCNSGTVTNYNMKELTDIKIFLKPPTNIVFTQ